MIYELWCRDAAFIKLKIERLKIKKYCDVGTQRAAFLCRGVILHPQITRMTQILILSA